VPDLLIKSFGGNCECRVGFPPPPVAAFVVVSLFFIISIRPPFLSLLDCLDLLELQTSITTKKSERVRIRITL
jgi:hypothetical protein